MSLSKVAFLSVLLLCLPLAAFANSTFDFTYTGGRITATASGALTTGPKGATLTSVTGFMGGGTITGSNLGGIFFTTGSLMSGSLATGAMLAGGGSFSIMSNGTAGLPAGALFTGTFTGPVSWTAQPGLGGGPLTFYTLTGNVTGTFSNGVTVTGQLVSITFGLRQPFHGNVGIKSGSGSLTVVVPEPASLTLMGTGMLAIAGLLRRRARAARTS